MAANETDPKALKALEELKAEFAKTISEIDKRIVALGERVVKLEEAPASRVSVTHDIGAVVEAVNALHLQVMGVPVGALQSLHDDKPGA